MEEFQFRFLMNKVIGEERLGKSSILAIKKAGNGEPPSLVKLSQNSDDVKYQSENQNFTSLSRSYLLSSFLFAVTRLGWLGARPDDVTHPSPYSWTVGFIQSIMAHFSSYALSDLRPRLQMALTIFALHQFISTLLVCLCVFIPFYERGGLAASMGAHLAWTIGKISIPFRFARRLLLQRTKREG